MGVTPPFGKGFPAGQGVVVSQDEPIRLWHTRELGSGLATGESGDEDLVLGAP